MRLFLVSIFLILGVTWWCRRPLSHPPGILVRSLPRQITLEKDSTTVERNGFSLNPLAGYVVEGRVLHTKHYLTDPVHKLAPYDVALGWGKMSDTEVLKQLDISQSNRFFFWQYTNHPPLPLKEIETHAANCHLIAADKKIARQIAWLRKGEVIRIEGSLIEATGLDGNKWTSSLRRDDTGKGACEIIWVSNLTKL